MFTKINKKRQKVFEKKSRVKILHFNTTSLMNELILLSLNVYSFSTRKLP